MNESVAPLDMDRFDRGVEYEALRDALNSEIARHLAALDADPKAPEASIHDMAATTLTEARQRLNPNNAEAIWLAGAIMRSYRDKIPAEARPAA